MGWMNTLRGRLRLAAAMTLLAAIVATTVTLIVTGRARDAGNELSGRLVPAAALAGALQEQYTVEQTGLREYVTNGTAAGLQQYETAHAQVPLLEQQLAVLLAGYGMLPQQFDTVRASHLRWLTNVAAPQLAAINAGLPSAAQALQGAGIGRPYVLDLRGNLGRLQTRITAAQATLTADLRDSQNWLLVSQLVLSVAMITTIGIMLALARRWLLGPVSQLRAAAESVAAGRHETVVPHGGPEELAHLGRSVELMRDRLMAVVTDREAAERRHLDALESAPDATLQVAADGTIRWVNGQAIRVFGYQPEELVGQPVEVLVPHAARAGHMAHRGAYLENPRPRQMGSEGMALTGVRRDGTEFPVEISLSSHPAEEGPLVTAAVRDVSERVAAQAERDRLREEAERERYERRLAQSQRLESLGQLVGGVAHDFNNLLNVILGYTGFVTERIDQAARGDEDWVTTAGDMRQINEAAERAARLTHQLLAFGRREVIQPRVLNMNETVTGLEQLLRRTLGEHIDLVCTLNPQLWPIKADPGQLEQVLVNLAVNARDAMPAGGKLTVDTDNTVVDEVYAADRPGLAPGRYVRLRVSDSGVGMPREVLARVFEPFFTTKPKGQGTGLGLATVYGIITQAGGHPQLYSEPGYGTTFTALMPVTEDTPASTLSVRADRVGGHGETIVVAEDERSRRDLVARILARHGYQVRVATTVQEALALAGQLELRIDLLLTDVVMPSMLGSELASRAAAIRPGLRVLYMSGYAAEVLDAQGTLPVGGELLEKPFTEDGLLARVRQVLDMRQGWTLPEER
jgi:PAS domain S-box-containing protein